jgi:hypothetical protein
MALAFLCAGLAHFLDAAQGPGMIFRAWRAWTFRVLWFKGRARIDYQEGINYLGLAVDTLPAPDYYRPRACLGINARNHWTPPIAWRRGLYKILGGCIYCSAVWTGSFFFVIGASFAGAPFALIAFLWPLFVGAQYAFTELIFAWSGPKK